MLLLKVFTLNKNMKTHAQEFTVHLNSKDDDIKWTTEEEVTTHTVSSEKMNIGIAIGTTKRTLPFLDTWLVSNDEVQLRPKCTTRRPIQTRIYTVIATTHWSIRKG